MHALKNKIAQGRFGSEFRVSLHLLPGFSFRRLKCSLGNVNFSISSTLSEWLDPKIILFFNIRKAIFCQTAVKKRT